MNAKPNNAQDLFDVILPGMIERNLDKAKAIDATFAFHVIGAEGGTWVVDLNADQPSCRRGYIHSAHCNIEVHHEDFMDLVRAADTGRHGMQLYFQGKLKITGDPMLATRLQRLFALE
jgi:hypothetical protein